MDGGDGNHLSSESAMNFKMSKSRPVCPRLNQVFENQPLNFWFNTLSHERVEGGAGRDEIWNPVWGVTVHFPSVSTNGPPSLAKAAQWRSGEPSSKPEAPLTVSFLSFIFCLFISFLFNPSPLKNIHQTPDFLLCSRCCIKAGVQEHYQSHQRR